MVTKLKGRTKMADIIRTEDVVEIFRLKKEYLEDEYAGQTREMQMEVLTRELVSFVRDTVYRHTERREETVMVEIDVAMALLEVMVASARTDVRLQRVRERTAS